MSGRQDPPTNTRLAVKASPQRPWGGWGARLAGFVCGLGLLLWAPTTSAALLQLTQAEAQITVQGESQVRPVQLPYHWDRQHPGQAGYASFEFHFDLDPVSQDTYGLYLPKIGNAYEIWLNGALLQRNGDMGVFNRSDYAKAPRLALISADQLRPHNLLRVRIRADMGRRAGLSTLTLGPYDEVHPLYQQDERWLVMGSSLVMLLSLLVGGLALALWCSQVSPTPGASLRRDPLYLTAALAEWSWALGVSNFVTERDWLAWPWGGIVIFMTTPVWATCMTLFCVEITGWTQRPVMRWVRRWLFVLLLACLLGVLSQYLLGLNQLFTLWYVVFGITYLLFCTYFVLNTGWSSSLQHKVVALALYINVAVGLHDIYVLRFSEDYMAYTYLRYSSILFGMALLYIVLTRFQRVSRQAHELSQNLALRVTQREQELQESYQRLEDMAREQARVQERTRILRDMHDGVGAHISTAIRQLQSGKVNASEVLNTMRDSLDQLKLSLDAMNLPPGDITALLANVRYRLGPRLAESNIELQWDVALLPPLPGLDGQGMRQLQFMLFEAFSNVLQHAHASVLRVELKAQPLGGVTLRVIDNGRGLAHTDWPRGNGFRSLRERAVAIHAQLNIRGDVGGTVVEIGLF